LNGRESKMSEPKIITASLEGMRVLADEKQCELQEYNFSVNQWFSKDVAPWPLTQRHAEEWLSGWNNVDRFAAMSALTRPADYPAAPRFVARPAEPRL